ncbi:MAG: hypothetical protein MK212_07935 [Saprospiraceae bacterium]|nr:hypothetical protein [Saprospiraceae bacterium]
MNKITDKSLVAEFTKTFLLGLLLVISTFPSNEWTYSTGIDPPLSWVYNYLFANGLDLGKHIVFPHGPLAFFMYPLPENIVLATLVCSLLKLGLFFNLINLSDRASQETKWLLVSALTYFIIIIAPFNHLILANLILLYCNAFLSEKQRLRFLAYFLTAFAFYVKAYVAILAGLISISYIGYQIYADKKLKKACLDIVCLLGFILAFWMLMYGSLDGFVNYIWGIAELAQDNSSAAAYYPENNWWVLGLFFSIFPILIILNRTKEFIFYVALISLSLFAAWKHGMARQDIYHVKGFYFYFIICSIILLVYYKKNTFINFIILSFGFILFTNVLVKSVYYTSLQHDFFRANNFIQFITEFEDLKARSTRISKDRIVKNKLPQEVLEAIGEASVDIYPWDYTIIAANGLNWQPRVIINSYAAYTSWLDQQNANHFSSSKAPEYLIWELEMSRSATNGSAFNSIDNRYLLNDEPKTMIEFLRHYEHWFSNNKFLILKKRNTPLNIVSNKLSTEQLTWSTWQEVPTLENGQLLRVQMNFDKHFLQRMKSFVYKDEQFWIYLKLQDNSVHKYRIVPKNAVDGLWVNPYLYTFDQKLEVKEIMFKASNEAILEDTLTITWETYQCNEPNILTSFFAMNNLQTDTLIYENIHEFEENNKQYWSEINTTLISEDAFNGNHSFIVKPETFSATFVYPLDSLLGKELKVETDCWLKGGCYEQSTMINLVISVEHEGQSLVWRAVPMGNQFIDARQWNHLRNFISYKNTRSKAILKVYLWNTSDKKVLIDHFGVRISTERSAI